MTRQIRRREALAAGAVAVGTVTGCISFGGGGGADWQVGALATADGTEQWTATIDGGVDGGLALSDGTLFVTGDFGLWAFATADGSQQWHFDPDGLTSVQAQPTVAGNDVYYATENWVQCLATADGSERWRATPDGDSSIATGPVRAGDAVVVGFKNGRVAGYETADGTRRWERTADKEVASVAATDDGQVLVGTNGGRISALDVADGTERWRRSVPTGVTMGIGPTITVADGVAYVGSPEGKLFMLKTTDGTTRWSYDSNDLVHLTVEGNVAFGGHEIRSDDRDGMNEENGQTLRFNLGEETYLRWAEDIRGTVDVAPGVGSEAAFFATSDRGVYALSRTDADQRWHSNPGGEMSSPVVADGRLFVGLR